MSTKLTREHQPGHREDEQAEDGEEAGIARVAGHVAGGEDGDERGDERDHGEHHRRQAVDAELDGHVERPVAGRVGWSVAPVIPSMSIQV